VDYLTVLDLEATCDSGPWPTQDIIEFPVVVVDCARLGDPQYIPSQLFRRYVRPIQRPQLTDFCTGLTGISQDTVDAAEPFASLLREFEQFFLDLSQGGLKSVAFVTCGDWELRSMLPWQCARAGVKVPAFLKAYQEACPGR
jgi:ERI1 exoribonuclease 3